MNISATQTSKIMINIENYENNPISINNKIENTTSDILCNEIVSSVNTSLKQSSNLSNDEVCDYLSENKKKSIDMAQNNNISENNSSKTPNLETNLSNTLSTKTNEEEYLNTDETNKECIVQATVHDLFPGQQFYVRKRRALQTVVDFPLIFWRYIDYNKQKELREKRSLETGNEMCYKEEIMEEEFSRYTDQEKESVIDTHEYHRNYEAYPEIFTVHVDDREYQCGKMFDYDM